MTAPIPDPIDQAPPDWSQALSDLADIERRQGGIDAEDPDSDFDPWG